MLSLDKYLHVLSSKLIHCFIFCEIKLILSYLISSKLIKWQSTRKNLAPSKGFDHCKKNLAQQKKKPLPLNPSNKILNPLGKFAIPLRKSQTLAPPWGNLYAWNISSPMKKSQPSHMKKNRPEIISKIIDMY